MANGGGEYKIETELRNVRLTSLSERIGGKRARHTRDGLLREVECEVEIEGRDTGRPREKERKRMREGGSKRLKNEDTVVASSGCSTGNFRERDITKVNLVSDERANEPGKRERGWARAVEKESRMSGRRTSKSLREF